MNLVAKSFVDNPRPVGGAILPTGTYDGDRLRGHELDDDAARFAHVMGILASEPTHLSCADLGARIGSVRYRRRGERLRRACRAFRGS
jgi:hypothetical protein